MKYKIDTDTESEEEKEILTKMNQDKSTKATASSSTPTRNDKGKNIEVEATPNRNSTPIRDRKISRFNNATETSIKLTGKENYSIWAPEMKNILSMHHLDDYLFEEYLKKVKISEVPPGDINNYTKIPGDKRRVYDISVTEEMIDDDKHAKFIIDRSVTETVKRKINFGKYTTYELWNIFKNSYNESDGERRRLKDNLDKMRYDRNEDFVIFVTNLNETFDELEDLGESFTNQEKFDYLYKMLPQSISIASNMIIHRNNFENCVDYLSDIVPTIKQLQLEISINKGRGTGNVNMSAETSRRKSKKLSKTNHSNKKDRKNLKCFNCGGIGHMARECPSENRHNEKVKNLKSRKFRESNYTEAIIDTDENKRLNRIFEKNILIDHNEGLDESNNAMARTKHNPRHGNK